MANLNIRNFPSDVLHDLNGQAERAGMTLRGYVIQRLTGKVQTHSVGQPMNPTGFSQFQQAQEQQFNELDEQLDYSDVPYDDCPPEEKKRRREAALAKRGIGVKP